MRNFLKGMASIDLFPSKSPHASSLPNYSDQQALENDWNQVGNDMWYAVEKIKHEHPECK